MRQFVCPPMEKELAPGADVGVITHCEVALLPCDHTHPGKKGKASVGKQIGQRGREVSFGVR